MKYMVGVLSDIRANQEEQIMLERAKVIQDEV